jgi:hypothetical protein
MARSSPRLLKSTAGAAISSRMTIPVPTPCEFPPANRPFLRRFQEPLGKRGIGDASRSGQADEPRVSHRTVGNYAGNCQKRQLERVESLLPTHGVEPGRTNEKLKKMAVVSKSEWLQLNDHGVWKLCLCIFQHHQVRMVQIGTNHRGCDARREYSERLAAPPKQNPTSAIGSPWMVRDRARKNAGMR